MKLDIGHTSDNVREGSFHVFKPDVGADGHDRRNRKGAAEKAPIRRGAMQNRPAEGFHDANHGIKVVQKSKFRGDGCKRVDNRRRKHPELKHERQSHADIAEAHLKRGSKQSQSR